MSQKIQICTFTIWMAVVGVSMAVAVPATSQPTVTDAAANAGVPAVEIAAFDLDKNGLISRKEFVAYATARARRLITINADANKDGYISPEEYAAYNAKFEEAVQKKVGRESVNFDQWVAFENMPSIPARDLVQVFPPVNAVPPESMTSSSPYTFLLREKVDDLAVELDKANPATLSYSRDFESSDDLWQTHGVVGFGYVPVPSKLKAGDPNGTATSNNVVPFGSGSIAFDRVTPTPTGKDEVNALITRLQFGLLVGGDTKFINLHEFRVSGSFGTDFDWAQKVPAIEVEYEPTIFPLAVGVAHRFAGLVAYRWRVIAHGEYRRIVDAGDNSKIQAIEGTDSTRLGPKIQLELWPSSPVFSRLGFTFGYTHLNDVTNGGSSDLFTGFAKYKLDEKGNVYLTLEYRNGDTPLVEQDVNRLTIGIGLKF